MQFPPSVKKLAHAMHGALVMQLLLLLLLQEDFQYVF